MDKSAFEEWALVELFGHTKFAGKVTEQSIGGCSFVRLDVPAGTDRRAFTKIYGQNAIYCITITDEQTAREAADHLPPTPLPKWSGAPFAGKQRPLFNNDDTGDDDDSPY